MKSAVPLLLFALLPACTRNRVVGYYPDGSFAQEIECRREHPEKCQQRSQEICQPRQPQVLRPLYFDQVRDRWMMVVNCGPPGGSPPPLAQGAPPPMAPVPAGGPPPPPPPPGGLPPATPASGAPR